MDIEEIRNWILLILAVIGAFVTLRSYLNSIRQRKIDNTYKTLDFLRKHIQSDEIETFKTLFHANNELSGVAYNEFSLEDGRKDTIETMFSEGGCGNGDIHNMIELFNLISPTLDKLEKEIIWYEYGQIMNKLYQWTKYLEEIDTKKDNKQFYSQFNKFMKKNWNDMLFKPTKYYTYAE
ncbi:hypothetical protein EVU94_13835 [Flavobacteriaceae bacterium 144Ye]|nr:hypothetical protein EVU94_13835 [Flavobacteriaceae bacterium 144Ye]